MHFGNEMKRQLANFLNRFLDKPHAIDIAAGLLFLLLTIIASWPILTNLNTVIIGYDPDVHINPWADWWTLKALQDPEISLWQTNYLFYPHGANLSYHSFSHLNTLVSLALRPIAGVLGGYNLAILLNYVLSGLAMFQLARYVTKSTVAGLLAGMVFAFNSHNQYQSCHPVLISIWCFAWITLYFMRAVRENRVKWAVVAAVFVFLGTFSSTVLLIMIGMWMAILVIYMFFSADWPRPPWRIVLTFGLLSLLFVSPLLYPLLRDALFNSNDSFLTNPYVSIRMDMFSIFVPHWYLWLIRGLYFGIMPLYLVFLAYGYRRREARLWFLLLIGAYLFSIGPRPYFAGNELNITLPWTLPVAPVLRNMYRMNILMSLGLAMLVAHGWIALTSQLKRVEARYIAAVIALLMVYLDYTAAPFPHTQAEVSSFYTEYLDNVPNNVVLSILPTGRQEDKRYLFYQTLHEHPMTGGVISRSSPETFSFIYGNPLLRAGAVDLKSVPIPRNIPSHLQTLAAANVGYLIFDKTLMETAELEEWQDSIPSSPIFEDELVLVYSTNIVTAQHSPPQS